MYELQALFSIKNDVLIKIVSPQQRVVDPKSKNSVAKKIPKASNYNYKQLKNNYLHAKKETETPTPTKQ